MSSLLYDIDKFGLWEYKPFMLHETARLFGDCNETSILKIGKLLQGLRKPESITADDYRVTREFQSICIRVQTSNRLVGFALASTWPYLGRTVCWITELVIHRDHRRQGLATMLLRELKGHGDIFGITGYHPAACMAARTAFGNVSAATIRRYMQANARKIIESSPINDLKRAKMVGALCIKWTLDYGTIPTIIASNAIAELDSAYSGERPLCTLERHEFLLIPPAPRSTGSRRRAKTKTKYPKLLLDLLFCGTGAASST